MKKMLLGLSTIFMASGLLAADVPHVPGEIIVKFKAGRGQNFLKGRMFSSLKIKEQRDINLSYDTLSVLKVSDDNSLISTLSALKNNPDIEFHFTSEIHK